MSSITGHALIGFALFVREPRIDPFRFAIPQFLIVALALSPDVDYLFYWLLQWPINPRYTHTIIYALAMGISAWILRRVLAPRIGIFPSAFPLFIAPLSHLMLDLLVAVHPVPLFWPFTTDLVRFPMRILPSAARISMSNYYFWRNFFIETGILLPIAIAIVPRWRQMLFNGCAIRQWPLFGIWLCFMACGIRLAR